MGGAIFFKSRSRRFMKLKTFVSLVMFGMSTYLFIIADDYIEDHMSLALTIASLAIVCLLIGIVLAYKAVTSWQASRKREEEINPVRTVRFSSLLNVYQEYDQSFDEESIDGGSPTESGIPWSDTNDDPGRTSANRPGLGNSGRSWDPSAGGSPCVSGRGRRGKHSLFPQASTSTTSNSEGTHAAGGLSPEVSAVPSFEYWMSLPKDDVASHSQSDAFRERNCLWYENSDDFRTPEETQDLSAKDKELFDNDDGEEIIL